jgi:hypothetical protein
MEICLQSLLLQSQIALKAQQTVKQLRSRKHLLRRRQQQRRRYQLLWMLTQSLQGWISNKCQLVWRLLPLLLTSACPRLLTQQHWMPPQQLLLLL